MPVLPPPVPPAEPGRRKMGFRVLKILGYGFGAVLAVGFLAAFVVGSMMEQGLIPDSRVSRAPEIPDEALEIVNILFDLEEGERVEFLYSAGFMSYFDDGQFVTNRRIGSWQDAGVGMESWECRIEDITSLELELLDSFFQDSWITAGTADGQTVPMVFSSEDGLDRVVADWLVERLPEEAVVTR